MDDITAKFSEISERGFTRLENFIPFESVKTAERLLDEIILSGAIEYTHIDFNRPSKLNSELLLSDIFTRCQRFASEYFGKTSHYLYDHAIYKFSSTSNPTEWHQDQAYLSDNNTIRSLHFWIPFQNSDEHNGVIRFYDKKIDKLLQHEKKIINGASQMVLTQIPTENIVAGSVSIGDVTIHTNMTVHGASSNRSSAPRKAWIIHFGDKHVIFKRMDQIKHALSLVLNK